MDYLWFYWISAAKLWWVCHDLPVPMLMKPQMSFFILTQCTFSSLSILIPIALLKLNLPFTNKGMHLWFVYLLIGSQSVYFNDRVLWHQLDLAKHTSCWCLLYCLPFSVIHSTGKLVNLNEKRFLHLGCILQLFTMTQTNCSYFQVFSLSSKLYFWNLLF